MKQNLIKLIMRCCVLMICLVVGASPADAQGSRASDSLELIRLYDSTSGTSWHVSTNWKTNNPISTWYGIRVNAQGYVDSIGLISNQLVGNLPNLNMPNLKRLFLHNNQLTGTIPDFNGTSLASLQLSRNQFTGNIPNFNLPDLGYLQLSYNQLTGSIPNFDSTRLNWLSLGFNQLTGNIPNFNLANLATLQLSNNQLTGALPPFNQCPLLYNLQIDNNRFTFDKLTRLITSRTWNTLLYAPQDSFHQDTTYNRYRSSPLPITLNIAPQDSNTVFNWYKGQNFLRSTQNNPSLDLANIAPADAGNYTCKVTNSTAPQLTLFSRNIRVHVLTTPIIQGGTRTDLQCGDRPYQLPSGRFVHTFGTHYDTLRHTDATYDTAYVVLLRSDTTCHCQDSIALAGMYHTSGGFPQNWNLNLPMTTWGGLTFNNTGCVTTWQDTRPDSLVCMTLNGSASLNPDFGIWELVNGTKKWFRNGIWVATYTGNPLNINPFRQLDSGKYVCRTDLNVGQFALIPTLRSVVTRAYQVRLCCTTTFVQTDSIIRVGNCVNWCGIARCSTGIYTCSTINPNTGCETIQKLNLRVDTCSLDVRLSQVGNMISALASATRPIVYYRWSNGIHGADKSSITIQTSGAYRVTVTDDFNCEKAVSINATFDPTLNFRMDSIQLSCTSNGNGTSIILQQPVRNAAGYTIRVNFDTALLRLGAIHRYNYLMSNDSHYMYPPVIVRNQLVITFVVTGVATMNGNIGDTLIVIAWQPKSNLIPNNPVTLLNGWVEESIRNVGGQTNYRIQNQIRLIPTGGLLTWMQGVLPNAQNGTTVKIGAPRQMRIIGTASNVTPFLIAPFRNETLQYERHAQRVVGLPDIGGGDCRLASLMVAGVSTTEILGLSQTQIIATDVNGDGIVNANDLAEMEFRGTHLVSGFLQNSDALHAGHEQSWRTFPKYRLVNDPEYQINSMRYVDMNGIMRYRIPKIDTVFNLNTGYGNRCDTASVDIQAILLGDVNGNNQDVRKGKLSNGLIKLVIPENNAMIRRIPIYVDSSFNSIDTKIENFDANLRILGLDTIHQNLRLVLNTGDIDKKSYMIGYTTNGNNMQTHLPIAYLRVQYDGCLKPIAFGALTGYLNSQLVDMNVNPSLCTPNEDLIEQPRVSIFPNPSSTGLFTIESSEKLGTIRVYDALGRMIKTMETIDNQLNIDLTDYSDGLYMVRIGQQSYKIMKH